MNLKIKLKDPKSCEGCPWLEYYTESICQLYNFNVGNSKGTKRLERCIEENGD
jgi:hypothetical protein